jgi:hypothetical protein
VFVKKGKEKVQEPVGNQPAFCWLSSSTAENTVRKLHEYSSKVENGLYREKAYKSFKFYSFLCPTH